MAWGGIEPPAQGFSILMPVGPIQGAVDSVKPTAAAFAKVNTVRSTFQLFIPFSKPDTAQHLLSCPSLVCPEFPFQACRIPACHWQAASNTCAVGFFDQVSR